MHTFPLTHRFATFTHRFTTFIHRFIASAHYFAAALTFTLLLPVSHEGYAQSATPAQPGTLTHPGIPAQPAPNGQDRPGIYYADIPRFWTLYDSLHTTHDTALQQQMIQQLYLDQGTPGLKEMAAIRNWKARRFLKVINAVPSFWTSIRPNTLNIQRQIPGIQRLLDRYKQLYKDFREPGVYFMIGDLNTGGTTTQTHVLIGAEIAAADSTTDAGKLSPFLRDFFRENKGITQLVAHELTHTQQKGGDMEDRRPTNLLGFCLAEGMCDFMAEQLMRQPLITPYIVYGKSHEQEIWRQFKQEMHGKNIDNWLYNGGAKAEGKADLGYFVGYSICKAFYGHAHDKKKAIHDIISLNLEDLEGLDRFLSVSGYDPAAAPANQTSFTR